MQKERALNWREQRKTIVNTEQNRTLLSPFLFFTHSLVLFSWLHPTPSHFLPYTTLPGTDIIFPFHSNNLSFSIFRLLDLTFLLHHHLHLLLYLLQGFEFSTSKFARSSSTSHWCDIVRFFWYCAALALNSTQLNNWFASHRYVFSFNTLPYF